MLKTTVGRALVNAALPPAFRDYARVLDTKGTQKLLADLAEKLPGDQYRDVLFAMHKLGHKASYWTGGNSFGLEHMSTSRKAKELRSRLEAEVDRVWRDPRLTVEQKEAATVEKTMAYSKPIEDAVFEESLAEGNPLANQVVSGARGNKMNLRSIRGGDLLYVDNEERPVPVPILRSYSEGLRPWEYYAGSFGSRKGLVDSKQSVADTGFFCLAKGTPVRLPGGSSIPIEQVEEGDVVLGADRNGKTFPVKVTARFARGVRDVWRYRFRIGKSRGGYAYLESTPEHKALAVVRRGRADSLRGRKASVPLPTVLPLGRAYKGFQLVPPQGGLDSASDIGLLSEPRAALLGLLLGDGGFTTDTTYLSTGDGFLVRRLEPYLSCLGLYLKPRGIDHPYEFAVLDRGRTAHGQRNRLRTWLRSLGLLGKYAQEKFIPTEVYSWDDSSVAALLGGLYEADGCITTAKGTSTVPVIVLCLSSKPVVEAARDLLMFRFGIHGSTVKTYPPPSNGNHPRHVFVINNRDSVLRFQERIPLPGRKQAVLASLCTRMAPQSRQDSFVFSYVDKEKVGPVDTYDIEVDHPDHLFVLANGMIVSNSKQLVQATHRLLVAGRDREDMKEDKNAPPRGLPVSVTDPHNEGSALAVDTAGYKKNTVLTPRILADLKDKLGDKGRLLVRSVTVGGPPDGGVYALDAGMRERGGLPNRGDFIGVSAGQALSEGLTQATLCLAEGTQVRMADHSVKPVEQIKAGEWVQGADVRGNTFPVLVKRAFVNGLRPCVRAEFGVASTKDRVFLTATADHKVLATTWYWSPTRQIVKTGLFPLGQKCVQFGAFMPRSSSGVSPLREEVHEPMALLLGLLLGDGCYKLSVHGVFLSCFDQSLIEDIRPYLASLELRPHLCAGQRGYYRISRLQDNDVRRDLVTGQFLPGSRHPVLLALQKRGMYDKYAHEKGLPPDVWSWDKESVAQLIGGLIVTDGSVQCPPDRDGLVRNVYVEYASTSLELIDGLRELLRLRFAVHAAPISVRRSANRKRPLYKLSLCRRREVLRFADEIPLYGCKKRLLADLIDRWTPRQVKDYSHFYRKSLTDVGSLPTYDLEVDHPDHLFVLANGLIVSNSSKHAGGVASAAGISSGFALVNQYVQVPAVFKGGATHADADGRVQSIEKAPQGGHYVLLDGGKKHYVPAGLDVTAKVGSDVEAGDLLSSGLPNPAEIVKHKGIGEGRRYFTDVLFNAYKQIGIPVHRRNVELAARGLIDHVRLNAEHGRHVPDDVVPYSRLEAEYEPREGHEEKDPKGAMGMYLERPVLHFTVGTKIRPSVIRDLQEFGVKNVLVHREPPVFEPEMIRGMENLSHDPDWMTRFLGSYVKKNFLRGVHRGDSSDEKGTSYVPSLARAVDFGSGGPVSTDSSAAAFAPQGPAQSNRPPLRRPGPSLLSMQLPSSAPSSFLPSAAPPPAASPTRTGFSLLSGS